MFLCQQFAGFNQIVDTLSLVCDLDRTEKNELPFLRQPAFSAGFLLIVRLEQIRVDGVRDTDNRLSGEQSADFGLLRQPAATAYKRDGCLTINFFLLPEDSGR